MVHNIIEGLAGLAVPIESVKVDMRNARVDHDLKKLGESLTIYGQRKPIVVNKRTGSIEAGNGTFMAARFLDWDHIAVVFVDDDESTAIGYSIADNRLGELSRWDNGTLDSLLEEATTFTGFDAIVEEFTETPATPPSATVVDPEPTIVTPTTIKPSELPDGAELYESAAAERNLIIVKATVLEGEPFDALSRYLSKKDILWSVG